MTENTQNTSDCTILIVDDNEDILDVLEDIIDIHTNFKVRTASDAKKGLSILKDEHIDVILLDLHMPGMDGIELLKVIRNREISAPVIFLSGKGSEEKSQEAFALGAFDFLSKPVKARDLLILLDEAHKVSKQVSAIKENKVSNA